VEEKKLVHTAKQAPTDNAIKNPSTPLKAGIPSTKAPMRRHPGIPTHLSALRNRLLTQGVDSAVVETILQSTLGELNPQALRNDQLVYQYVGQQLQSRLPGNGNGNVISQRVVCIIGANGSGKTSLGAKVAAHAARAMGRKVRWITTDTLRAGAIAKAQAFTAPLGIPLNLAYSPEELAALVKNTDEDELVVVDTPGCNPYRNEEITDLGTLLEVLSERYTVLVAPATSKEVDLQETATVFLPLGVDGLAISKMDETLTFGDLYNFACRTSLPIAFFTTGPRIIGDLRSADPSILVDALLGRA
jgi:flagellar biosynthesis GTPase FlhF